MTITTVFNIKDVVLCCERGHLDTFVTTFIYFNAKIYEINHRQRSGFNVPVYFLIL